MNITINFSEKLQCIFSNMRFIIKSNKTNYILFLITLIMKTSLGIQTKCRQREEIFKTPKKCIFFILYIKKLVLL